MNERIANRYIEVARALKPKLQNGRSFHVTCIFDKSKLLAMRANDYQRHHPRHRFGVYKPLKGGGEKYIPATHGEIAALIALGEEDCSRYTFFNIRINNNGETAMAKPCLNCMRVLDMVGYKKLFYTTKDSIMEHCSW